MTAGEVKLVRWYCALLALAVAGCVSSHSTKTTALDPVTATIAVVPDRAGDGDEYEVVVRVQVGDGFHIYPMDKADAPIGVDMANWTFLPTSLKLTTGRGLAPDGPWIGSKPVFKGKDGWMYTGMLEFRRKLRYSQTGPHDPIQVAVELRYQVCTAEECFPPNTMELETRALDMPGVKKSL